MKNINIKQLSNKKIEIENISPKFIKIYTITLIVVAIIIFEVGYCNCEFFTNLIKNTNNNIIYNFSLSRVFLYVASIMIYIFFRKKFLPEAVETSKNKYKRILIYVAIIYLLIMIITIVFSILTIQEVTRKMSLLLLTAIMTNLCIIYVSNNLLKNVIVMLSTFGIIFSFATDFNHVADERKHFITAFNIAFLNLDYIKNPITDKQIEEFPDKLEYTKIEPYLKGKYKPNIIKMQNKDNIYFSPTVYAKILYVPSAIGIAISTFLGGSIIDLYIYGRILNLVLYGVLICIALKVLPLKKNTFIVVFLMPMLILYSATFSVDASCVGLVAIFVAYCLKLYKECETINLKQLLTLLGLFILMLFAKSMAYLFVGLAVLILPLKTTLKKNKKFIPGIILGMTVLLAVSSISLIYIANTQLGTDYRGTTKSNSSEQIQFMLNNPLSCVKLAINHFKDTLLSYSWISLLHHHAFFSADAKCVMFPMFLFILYVSIIDDDTNLKLKEKSILILAFLATIASTSIPLYITYTPVGAMHVSGYQTRYIFPILPLILMCISNNKVKYSKNTNTNMNISIISGIFIILGLIQLIF